MTEDEDVLARMAALEAELRADPKVQAELKARQAERIRADQASGDVPTILLDDSDPPGAGEAGETRDQKRARAIAALKAKRAAANAAAAPAPEGETVEQKRARAIARLKAERAAKNAAAAAAPARTASAPPKPAKPAAPAPDPFDDLSDDELLRDLLPARTAKPAAPAKPDKKPDKKADKKKAKPTVGDALELAGRAVEVTGEATRPKEAHEKSWLTAGLLGLVFGPAGWVYAGAWRESLPAGAAYVGIGFLASKILPVFMLMPALLVVLPVSAIVGVMYAAKFNKAGKRQRVFGENPAPAPEQLPAGRARGKLGPGRR